RVKSGLRGPRGASHQIHPVTAASIAKIQTLRRRGVTAGSGRIPVLRSWRGTIAEVSPACDREAGRSGSPVARQRGSELWSGCRQGEIAHSALYRQPRRDRSNAGGDRGRAPEGRGRAGGARAPGRPGRGGQG